MPHEYDLPSPRSDDHDAGVSAVAVSPDGRFGVTAARSGEVRLWDLAAGRLFAAVGGLHDGSVDGAVFTGDSRRLVTTGDRAARWTVTGESLEWRLLGRDDDVRMRSLVLGPGERSAMVAGDGDIRWWNLDDQRHGRMRECSAFRTLVLAGSDLAITGDGAGIRGWELPAPIGAFTPATPLWFYDAGESDGQRQLHCCDRGRLVVFPHRGRVVVLEAGTGAVIGTFVPPSRPTAIAAYPDTTLVVLGGRDGSLSWWDARSRRCMGRVQAHTDRIQALALASRTDLVLSGSRDGTAALCRLHGHAVLARFSPASTSRPAVPYGREDPWDLAFAAGSPDGRHWLIGGRGGQVHILAWSHDARLVPVRIGRPTLVTGDTDIDALVDDIRDHRADSRVSVDAARALAVPGALDHLDDHNDGFVRQDVWEALTDLQVNAADPQVREEAAIALAEIDRDVRTLYGMFARHRRHHGDSGGIAGRLRAHFTCEEAPTTEELIESLPEVDLFLAVLTSQALAERGAAAVPALHAALRSFPFPADEEPDTWWEDESTKYHLMRALEGIGAAAAPAIPTLLAVLEDDEIYRDTRHQAEVALRAIGTPSAVDAIAGRCRRRRSPVPANWTTPSSPYDSMGMRANGDSRTTSTTGEPAAGGMINRLRHR